jgi:PKD repeat protein
VFNQNGVVAKVGDIVDDGSILIEISSSAGVAINPYERQVAFHGRINSVDAVFVSLTPIPNSKPVADFTYATDDLTVTFTDLSRDRDGDVVAWSWDFGDGSTSTEQNPSHTYAEAGNYNVSLTVEDDQSGVSEPAEQSVEVSAPSSGEVVQVFATSVPHNGNFGGLPGADQFCQELAVTAGLSGTWRAWLSDENTDARDRIPDGEYRLLDASETVVASDLEDLTDGELDAPINVSEKGGPPATSSVWTSTKTDGTSIDPVPPGNTTSNCFNWTNADTSSCSPGDQDCGARGSTAAIDGTWTLLGGQANPSLSQCSTMQSIYCFGGGQ